MRWLLPLTILCLCTTAMAQVPDLGLPEGTPGVPGTPPEAGPVLALIPQVPDVGASLPPIPEASRDAAAAPLEYQHVAWDDGAHIIATPRDGHDLRSLWVWEHDHEVGGAGIMLRLLMESGSAMGGAAAYTAAVAIAVEDGEATTLAWESTDGGATWSGEGIVETGIQQSPGAVDAANATHTILHIHIPLESLGAAAGQNLTGFQAWTWVQSEAGGEQQPVDVAPGGMYLVTGGAEVPEPSEGGPKLSTTADPVPAYYLRGAGRHIDVDGLWAQSATSIRIENPYASAQQIRIAAPQGMSPRAQENLSIEPTHASLELAGGANVTIVYDAPLRQQAQQLQWTIRSDAGGITQVQVTLPALPPPPTQSNPQPTPAPQQIPVQRTDKVLPPVAPAGPAAEAEPEPAEADKDSPTAGFVIVGIGLLGVTLMRRR